MTFTTKLDIGDTIWHIKDGAIKEITVTDITVQYKPHADQNQQGYIQEVLYGTDDHCATYEAAEGKYWWRTQAEVVAHLLKNLKPIELPEGDLVKAAFKNIFGEEFKGLESKPVAPTPKINLPEADDERLMDKWIDELLTRPNPKHPVYNDLYDTPFMKEKSPHSMRSFIKTEKVRISLPPKPRNELSQLADEL